MSGVRWTADQQKVIDLRNRNILVSAAAGSGKTAVLVERIITMISEEKSKIDIDRLLIVTFTRAAAAEMKERIGAAIEKKLNEMPENLHLQKQMTLIHNAQITTIHSFCKSVIKNNFNAVNIDPAFRVGDDTELKLMKADVIEELLEQKYEEGNQEFLDFIESYSSAKSDANIEQLILQLYEFSMSYPWPEEWLNEKRDNFNMESLQEMESSDWMQFIMDYIGNMIREIVNVLRVAADICNEADGPYPYLDAIQSDLAMMEELSQAESYSEYAVLLSGLSFKRLSAKKDAMISEEKKTQVKAFRDEAKKIVNDIMKAYFFQPEEEMLLDIIGVKPHMNVLIDLTIEFMKEFSLMKEDKNILDYNDLEHFALNILVRREAGEAVPTNAAIQLSSFYEEILIDEYQDSNLVQETILVSISKEKFNEKNLFMVGDVKQSIYKFRLARPELFMEKFGSYSTDDSDCQRIDLHKNFRSRASVLHGINFIFEQIMTQKLGNIEYNQEAALYPGAEFPDEEHAMSEYTEVLLVHDSKDDSMDAEQEFTSKELEARAIAERVKEMTHPITGCMVFDKGEYRRAEFRDIVILLRTMSGWSEVFTNILMAEGVPACSDTQTGYFSALEIKTILNVLRIVDNPRQDIPFTAVLYSSIVNLTSRELAEIKSMHKELCIYDAVVSYREEGTDIQRKLDKFIDELEEFRELASYLPIHQLIQVILERTGYYHYVMAMPAGDRRGSNIDMLIQMAIHFEETSYHGLFQFNRYIDRLHKYEVDYGEAGTASENDNTVRIMSIHKSKGLEFPIVFVSGLGKSFNTQDTRSKLVLHPDLGIGPDFVDYKLRLKSPTLIKKAMQRQLVLENLGEELRILYVALTRAKEKLVMTAYVPKLVEKLSKWSGVREHKDKKLPFHRLASAGNYLDYVLPSLIRHRDFKEMLSSYELFVKEEDLLETNAVFKVDIVTASSLVTEELMQEVEKEVYKEELLNPSLDSVYDETSRNLIEKYFSYKYPFQQEVNIHAKVTVSELKKIGQMEDEEYSEKLFQDTIETEHVNEDGHDTNIRQVPNFLKEESAVQGNVRGSIYHKVLEHLNLHGVKKISDIQDQIRGMVDKTLIQESESELINVRKLYHFSRSPIVKRMKAAEAKHKLFKERQFVMGIPANELSKGFESSEIVLVQGIIDCYFEEEGEFVLLDYKTDWVSGTNDESILIQRYKVQLDYYAKALEKMSGKKVKERIIYSFGLGKEFIVPHSNSSDYIG